MASLNPSKCCDKCWHSSERPCPHVIGCLAEAPRCHESHECTCNLRDRNAKLRRDIVERPTIYVGTGSCGQGAGAGKTLAAIKEWLADQRLSADVVEVGCIGLCTLEPLVDIQLSGRARVCFTKVTEEKVPGLLDGMLHQGQPPSDSVGWQFRNVMHQPYDEVLFQDKHSFFAPQTRWVLANCGVIDPTSIEEYIARGGYAALSKAVGQSTPAEVIALVERSGLRGRGGGGFPTGSKWKFCAQEQGEEKYLICNADEGDPGAFMNRAEIEGDPHRLLEGLAIAAYAIGASKSYIYIRAEYPLAIKRLYAAIDQAKELGLLGRNILDSGFNLEIVIKQGAGAFVCGEETALIHSIEGRRGMPRPRPPYPASRGLFGKPTVINNVETLFNIPIIIERGAECFASIGSDKAKGTKVFALSGRVERAGLVEVPYGSTIRQIVFDVGGGIPDGKSFKAVQIGGPSGGCLPVEHLDLPVDYDTMKSAGAIMGSGGLVVMDESTCMIDLANFFMDFIQRESCGKCIPCREGTRRMLEILGSLSKGRRGEKELDALSRFKGVMQLRQLAEVIKDTSLCGLGQSAPNPVLSTLRYFREEYEAHLFERRCPAGVCKEMLTYTIDEPRCPGCGTCLRACPSGAIAGSPKHAHSINQDKCTACGSCAEVCRFNAVQVA